MKEMTLREMCDFTKVSRRAVQGYEKAGLVFASGKSERGYLLYDVRAQERVRQIKFLQQLGFTIKEIQNLIDAPKDVLKAVLEDQIEKLKEKKIHMERLISQAYELIETL